MERFEGGFDLDQLQVELPEPGWVRLGEVGAPRLAALQRAGFSTSCFPMVVEQRKRFGAATGGPESITQASLQGFI
ncbi:MAG: hypothetical protein A3G80_10615 [Betaproteobacteria bacterium RIFCSPLOWO2_12_FULL_62_13b]|nr:MAG: hypothetical protein A3G80_10615 [Betaproteobacteria bacterium RIFCSPLOWO2_12_FULL_62_13b]